MNLPKDDNRSEDSRKLEFLELVMHYQDGTLSTEEVQRLSELIRCDPGKRDLFRKIQIRTATLHDLLRMDAFAQSGSLLGVESAGMPDEHPITSQGRGRLPGRFKTGTAHEPYPSRRSPRRLFGWLVGGTLLGVLLMAGFFLWSSTAKSPVITQDDPLIRQEKSVRLVEEDRAIFFGSSLTAGSRVEPQRDYLLQSGLVKLQFPSGATAILEAPSIFRVESEERLVLNSGGCSVHAPDGAEGFEVLTPLTKVVDRGTRFYVNVQDNSETEVHVIEGVADLYSVTTSNDGILSPEQGDSQSAASTSVRLKVGESVRLGGLSSSPVEKEQFHPGSYRGQLPDRVVRYDASSTANGTADELTSLTVQRQGEIQTYTADELITIEVVSFRGDPVPEPNGYICGFREKPNRPEDLLEDRKLVTGLINFGGQPEPMNPRMLNSLRLQGRDSAPPGLGIRFQSPVVNDPGPDVVLFEIQSFGSRSEGDLFHVYPVSDRSDLKAVTIRQFDLTLDSPTVRRVNPLWSHRSQQVANSLDELRELETPIVIDVGHGHFQVIAVGIDLSEFGYAEGEGVEELFFQHASQPGGHKVDPVMIVGLPPVGPDR